MRKAAVVVGADTKQGRGRGQGQAARWERSQRADREHRDPNIVDAVSPRPRGFSPSTPMPAPRRSRAAHRDRDALER